MAKETKEPRRLDPSRIAPRRPPGTRGRHSPSYPELDFREAGRIVGITSTHVGRILNGICRPSMKVAERIGALMGWTIDEVNSIYIEKQEKQNAKSGNSSRSSKPNTKTKPVAGNKAKSIVARPASGKGKTR